MAWVAVVLLLIALIVFGITSSAQSYATAQQAQAQIEVAQVAQINAWGNLVVILAIVVIVVVILALIAAFVYLRIRLGTIKKQPVREPSNMPTISAGKTVELMVQMKLLEMLDSMNSRQQLPAPPEDVEEPISWIRFQ